jgi:hypothetical protein
MSRDVSAPFRRPIARLVAIWMLVSVLSPLSAICWPGAPGAMPCCVKGEAGAPPTVRACCGPAESKPTTALAPTATTVQAPIQTIAFLIVAPKRFKPVATCVARAAHVDIRILNSVFLI